MYFLVRTFYMNFPFNFKKIKWFILKALVYTRVGVGIFVFDQLKSEN